MKDIIYDWESWQQFSQDRWIFNKLELALKLEYAAGPGGVPVPFDDYYIVRPIYNLFGFGIGAKKVWLDRSMSEHQLIKLVPPGYFWCQYFEGNHYSIDLKLAKGIHDTLSIMQGHHHTHNNLVEFKQWTLVNNFDFVLPECIKHLSSPFLNIEIIGNKIIEVHLRQGNTLFDGYPVGTIAVPVWEHESIDTIDGVFIEDYEDASGLISRPRLGFIIKTQ